METELLDPYFTKWYEENKHDLWWASVAEQGQIHLIHMLQKAFLKGRELTEAVEEEAKCAHRNTAPSWDYVTCKDCGSIKIGNHRDWGIAAGKWYSSLSEAEFYREHGRLPQ
jgi:hypothetical protein